MLDVFLYKTPDADAEDNFPNSIHTFLENHKTDKINLSALADKYINIDDEHGMTSILLNAEFPFCRFYVKMNWDNYDGCVKLDEQLSHLCVTDTGPFSNSDYDVLRIFTYLGINKTYDGVVFVLGQMSLEPQLVDEDAESFVDDIDLMFGSIMKPNEKRQMVSEIINYSKQLEKKR